MSTQLDTQSTDATVLTATPSATYAQKYNAKFSKKGSHYVNLKERIDQRILSLPVNVQNSVRGNLIVALQYWKRRFPLKKTVADFDLCEAAEVPLSQIIIDDTIQRVLEIHWVVKILTNWNDVQVSAIKVYKPDGEEYNDLCNKNNTKEVWAAWDGQHTAVALYLIFVWGLGLDPNEIMVPVTKYHARSKGEIRRTFTIGNSSEGVKFLDEIDLFQQMIYGVRLDGVTFASWLEAEEKQTALENVGLFVTHEKFNDCDQAGAISRMKEINKFSTAVIQDFATYSKFAQAFGPRPVATMEMDIMCSWFDMARKSGIYYTEDEIQNLATHLQMLFNGDFSEKGPFWAQARIAYANWWDRYYSDPEYQPEKMVFKMLWSTGGVFLFYQLRKTWQGRIPKLTITSPFQPASRDLF